MRPAMACVLGVVIDTKTNYLLPTCMSPQGRGVGGIDYILPRECALTIETEQISTWGRSSTKKCTVSGKPAINRSFEQ